MQVRVRGWVQPSRVTFVNELGLNRESLTALFTVFLAGELTHPTRHSRRAGPQTP